MFTKLSSFRYIAVLLVGLLGLSACQKGTTDDTVRGAFTLYNASPTAATYDVYLNDTKMNSAALPLGGNLLYTEHTAGNYTLKFTVAGRAESVFTKEITVPGYTYSSIFLIGKPSAFDLYTVTDDLSNTSTTSAFVRFINVSPDAGTLDLFSKTTAIASGVAYKNATKFVAVDAGSHTFDVKQSGTTKVSTASMNLVAGYKYTVLVRGMLTPLASDDVGLGVQVTTNR